LEISHFRSNVRLGMGTGALIIRRRGRRSDQREVARKRR
jgi:hypothetical protein